MSNAYAIHAVTSALTHLLSVQLSGVLNGGPVTSRPLDKAREPTALTNQLNLFLYGVSINAALRNQDMPGVRPGETAPPPLALDLHYVLTAFGREDDQSDPISHVLLGHAMRVLHDNALIAREDLQLAQPLSDLFQQVERIKIVPQALSVEELSKLWTIFQTQYRVSTGYQVSVLLIESERAARTPPPVLRRGQDDRGVTSFPGTSSPLPLLQSLSLPPGHRDAQLGDRVSLQGSALEVASHLRLSHARLGLDVEPAIEAGANASGLSFVIEDDPSLWAAGLYALAIELQRPGETFPRTSNALPLALIPSLLTLTPASAPSGAGFELELSIKPAVRPGQRVSVLLGDAELRLPDPASPETELKVAVPPLPRGSYVVRVRVDGLDSSPIVSAGTPPQLQFAAAQTLTIT